MLRPVDTPPAMGNSAVAMPLIFFAFFFAMQTQLIDLFWNLENVRHNFFATALELRLKL